GAAAGQGLVLRIHQGAPHAAADGQKPDRPRGAEAGGGRVRAEGGRRVLGGSGSGDASRPPFASATSRGVGPGASGERWAANGSIRNRTTSSRPTGHLLRQTGVGPIIRRRGGEGK